MSSKNDSYFCFLTIFFMISYKNIMENNYKDNQLIDEKIMNEMAIAYASALKNLQEPNQTTTQTTEQLLTQILQELKAIRATMELNRRIRLS